MLQGKHSTVLKGARYNDSSMISTFHENGLAIVDSPAKNKLLSDFVPFRKLHVVVVCRD